MRAFVLQLTLLLALLTVCFTGSALALEVFRERGLISLSRQGDRLVMSLIPVQGKVDLAACPYLLRLQEKEAT